MIRKSQSTYYFVKAVALVDSESGESTLIADCVRVGLYICVCFACNFCISSVYAFLLIRSY
jgi:hypothetical protein